LGWGLFRLMLNVASLAAQEDCQGV
jgi:hypothetical protein